MISEIKNSFLTLALCAVLISCSQKQTDEAGAGSSSEHKNIQTDDSSMVITPVWKFNNNELYTELYFREDKESADLYDFLGKSADSLVYADDEITRTRLSLPIAEEYFDMDGFDRIDLFRKEGLHLGSADFVRVEFLEDEIESRFVAVFRSSGSLKDLSYGIIGWDRDDGVENFSFEKEEDGPIANAERISPQLQKGNVTLSMRVTIKPGNNTYSVLSADTTSYIIDDQSQNVIYKSRFSEYIRDVTPLRQWRNGKPVMLLSGGLPETDMTWVSLIVFNGKHYEVAGKNRLPYAGK